MAIWLETPLGRYVQNWEQNQLDEVVADVFGFHAVQLGLPQIHGLTTNRMPHRWQVLNGLDARIREAIGHAPAMSYDLVCDYEALPFPNASIDLLVLPHALELAQDPHLALREAERVLVPEGHLVILGFNPTSLWILRQSLHHWYRRFNPNQPTFMPDVNEIIGTHRLRDWLRLLNFEVLQTRHGCWQLPLQREKLLEEESWLELAGQQWLPRLGALYMMTAVKRVRGMHLVGPIKKAKVPALKPSVIATKPLATPPAPKSNISE